MKPAGDEAAGRGCDEDHGSHASELLEVLCMGFPIAVNVILPALPGLAMLHFVRSSPDHIAAAGTGFMFSNVIGLSLIMGFGSGCSPLVAQACGAGNFTRCGDLLQQQLAINAVLVAVIAAVWWNTERILLAFGQPPVIAALAGEFVLWRLPALPALALREDLLNYLVTLGVVKLPMLTGAAASFVCIAGFATLIPMYGFVGSALSLTLANLLQASLLLALARRSLPTDSAWPRWSARTAMSNWGELLRLALPTGFFMLSEWWGWEMNLFFAGLLCGKDSQGGCTELDTFPIVANTMALCFMPNFGFSIAAAILIGNALGANRPERARRLARVCVAIAVAFGVALAATLVSLRWSWGRYFSSDEEIVGLTARVLPVVALYVFLDQVGPGALSQVLRSMCVVRTPAVANIVAFYVVGIPFGLWLTFGRAHERWGIVGLWWGLVLGMALLVGTLLLIMRFCVNFDTAAKRSRKTALGIETASMVENTEMAKCDNWC
mmetsp:Transcript_41208/g.116643  ORF Transcript_41208/g.116643 Transcript_41208/m.116643 type:complete len:494 (-) Transcript_41208:316-1797(-)